MGKIREILRNEYIGAITIGFILAQCVSTVVSIVVQTGSYYWQIQHESGTYDRRPTFPWESLVISLVSALLYLVPAYLGIRWLYYPRDADAESDADPSTKLAPVNGE